MKTERKNTMEIHQLKDEKLTKIHKEELGLNVSEGYFAQSKNQILSKTFQAQNKSYIVDWFTDKNRIWKVAASLILFFGLLVYLQFTSNSISKTVESSISLVKSSNEINQSLVQSDSNQGTKRLKSIITNTNKYIDCQKNKEENVVQNENDILVKSLFVEEDEVDQYIENSILEDI